MGGTHHAPRLSRRRLLQSAGAGGLGLLAGCGRLLGQSPAKVPRIGVLGERASSDPFLAAFRQGLGELGYIEGQNLVVEYRYAHGAIDQLPTLAAEILALNIEVLVVGGNVSAQPAKALTSTVPIVFTLSGDPVESGLVASLAHPGGNVTGLANFNVALSPKHLDLLKMTVPQLSRVAVLYNPTTPIHGRALVETREAARALTVELQALEVREPSELASVFSALAAWGADGVLPLSDPMIGSQVAQLSQLAATYRLPAIFLRREFAESGGLMAYGPDFADNWRRGATYVDKILKGAKPADLPVEQPTRFEFVVNLRTADALGLTIPPHVLLQATEIIQ